MYSDSQGDIEDTGDQSDITVEYSQETMAELPVGQNEQTGESDLVLPLKKGKYECVDKQHEMQKEHFVKLECLDYQKWCQDTQSHAMKQKHKTVHDRKQKSSHSLLCPMCHKGFGSNIKLDTNVHTTHKGYKYQCNLCD